MATTVKSNTDIPGDPSEQASYMALTLAQKNLVDRAVYSALITHNANGYDFTPQTKSAHGGRVDSAEIEIDIEKKRDEYAKRVMAGNTGELTTLAQNAPDGPQARAMLNTIIKLNGNEASCGCWVVEPPAVDLNAILPKIPAKPGRSH